MKAKIIILALLLYAVHAAAQQPVCTLEPKNVDAFTRVEQPSIYRDRVSLGKTQSANITINYKTAIPDSAITAIEEAVNIWGWLLTSIRPIKIDVYWQNLPNETFLAAAGPTS